MKGDNTMKKILFTIALVMTMVCTINAQNGSDGFFSSYNNDYENVRNDSDGFLNMPYAVIGSHDNNNAPLGSGWLILTALGAGYAISRRKSGRR